MHIDIAVYATARDKDLQPQVASFGATGFLRLGLRELLVPVTASPERPGDEPLGLENTFCFQTPIAGSARAHGHVDHGPSHARNFSWPPHRRGGYTHQGLAESISCKLDRRHTKHGERA